MPLDAYKNFAAATLAAGINSSATSLSVASGQGARFPAVPFNATIYNATDYADAADAYHAGHAEIVRVTAISTDTLTITRAQESTSAVNLNTGGKTYRIVAGLTAKFRGNTPLGNFLYFDHFQCGQRFCATEGDWNHDPALGFGVIYAARNSTGSHVIRTDATESSLTINRAGTTWIYHRARLSNLSDSSDRYVIYIGTKDGGGDAGSNSFGVRYSDNINGGKWQCWARASNTETTADSGVTVAANTWYDIALECAPNAASIKVYIAGSLVATLTTNLPTSYLSPVVRFQINTSAGATRYAYLDYIGLGHIT